MAFHPVIELQIQGRVTKVYLQKETSILQPGEDEKLQTHLEQIVGVNRDILDHGSKNVLIVWGDANEIMTDWWVWGEKESESAGAGIEVYLFRGTKRYESPLVSAEDGLQVLASEIT